MKPESGQALFHAALVRCLCAATIHTAVFAGVSVQVGHGHCAGRQPPCLPAVPFTSLVNVAYALLGMYWLPSKASAPGGPTEARKACYPKGVFAGTALGSGPVQRLRIAGLDRRLTFPIFARPVARCLCLDRGQKPWLFPAVEGLSLRGYSLALLHPRGSEVALGVHVAAAVGQAPRAQGRHGSASSGTYLALGALSCLGFVGLKLCDHELSRWHLFQRLTGHLGAKVCDMLQLHFAFLFPTNLNTCRRCPPAEKMR
ncbi:LOW QUALITY PROTEIN: transmembrane protein 187 [Kogia breviceps]|uniref:LOW QUALITY PROTEIN: transmembrane protein 187 n=1 Tax=Kogia breviceps TaxID=27615 RepID=UPI0027961F02|nr:LOW QUALITY PROTEIN: transmembrane protein 187 [Kogia breviceps]